MTTAKQLIAPCALAAVLFAGAAAFYEHGTPNTLQVAEQVTALSKAAMDVAPVTGANPMGFGAAVAQDVHVRRSWIHAGQLRDVFGHVADVSYVQGATRVTFNAESKAECTAMLSARPALPVAYVSFESLSAQVSTLSAEDADSVCDKVSGIRPMAVTWSSSNWHAP